MSTLPKPYDDVSAGEATCFPRPGIRAFPRVEWIVMGVLVAALAFSFRRAEPDLWGHVQYGRDAIQLGLPVTTTYSYTAEGYPWINHENLFEISAAWLIDQGGVRSLLAFKSLLGLLVVVLVARNALREQVTWPVLGIAAVGLTLVLRHYWPARPQIFSYALCAAFAAILSEAFAGWRDQWLWPWGRSWARGGEPTLAHRDPWRTRLLWLMPLVFVLWTNSHGGFVAGLAIYLVYLALRGIEAWWVSGRESWGMQRRLMLMASAAVVVTFLNPYGPRLHAWLETALTVPLPEITEWHPLTWRDEAFLPFVLWTAAVALGLCYSRLSLDATHLAVLALVLWQSLTHQRHVPFFVILTAFWLPRHWQSAWDRVRTVLLSRSTNSFQTVCSTPSPSRWFPWCVWTANAILLVALWNRWSLIQVDRGEYPVSAIAYMRQHNLQGRLVVTYNWAQYALASMGSLQPDDPGVKVHFDGRFNTCYPQRIIDQHFDFILGNGPEIARYRSPNTSPPRAERILEEGQPDLVLISRLQEPSVHTMHRCAAKWVVLYQDPLSQVWGRRSVYDDPSSPHYLPLELRCFTDEPQAGWVP
ncbi:MAG TPA: hypothetical protein VIY86_10190, partial [Pirellulaceae bacterium]